MAIVAHPDDAEMYCGGTLAEAARQGATTALVIVTNGDKGGSCYNSTARYACSDAALAAIRTGEARRGSAVLGISGGPTMLGFEDAATTEVPEVTLRTQVTIAVRRFRPHVVLTHDPRPDFEAVPANLGPQRGAPDRYGNLGYHPDHQRVGGIVLDTVVGPTSRHDNILPQIAGQMGLHGWTADEFYMFAVTRHRLSHVVALGAQALAVKERAFECHRSQYTNASELREYVSWVGTQVARAGDVRAASAAEGFRGYF